MRHVDFLPEFIKAGRRRRQRILRQTYMLTICFAGLTLLGFLRYGRVETARAELAQLGAREADLSLQLQRRVDLERQKAELYIIQRIDEQLGSRLSTFLLLSELQRLVNEPMALIQLSVETMEVAQETTGHGRTNRTLRPRLAGQRPSGTGKTIKRLRLTLTGVTPTDVDVANFIGQMSACPLFEDVNMGYSKNVKIGNKTARQFEASCYVVH